MKSHLERVDGGEREAGEAGEAGGVDEWMSGWACPELAEGGMGRL